MTSSPIGVARSQYLLDLLAQVPDPRKKRGRRRPLAGLLAVGIAAVRDLLKAFAGLAAAVVTIDAMPTQQDTAQAILSPGRR